MTAAGQPPKSPVVSRGRRAPKSACERRQRQGAHRVFVDPGGRERLFHGSSAVVKGPPYVPDGHRFSPDISMARGDFQWMQRLGLNVLRLVLMATKWRAAST